MRRTGFTLIEMLIVVGAVAIIGLGVARIFSATGDTVKIGRQVSSLNSVAASVERQIRADILAMTREGVMVIKHEQIDGRRLDEIVFFAKGDYTSSRDPLHPQRVARANSARIYYGHGLLGDGVNGYDQQLRLDQTIDIPYFEGLNEEPRAGVLLRHVTGLVQPRTGIEDQLRNPQPPNGWFRASTWQDTDVQAGLLPAASSIYRIFNENRILDADERRVARTDDSVPGSPRFDTGIVDLATTDLGEVRAVILDAQDPTRIDLTFPFSSNEDLNVDGEPGVVFRPGGGPGAGGTGVFPNDASLQNGSATDIMQFWMRELLPAESYGSEPRRLRAEVIAPDAFGIVDTGLLSESTPDQTELAERVADQRALSASNFVPNCISFKIEWTFGRVLNPATVVRELRWHDIANPYDSGNNEDRVRSQYQNVGLGGNRSVPMYSDLIHGIDRFSDNQVLFSYFGYVTPYFELPSARDKTIPWRWPELLRFTITYADSEAPDAQVRTVQFVVQVPQDDSKG